MKTMVHRNAVYTCMLIVCIVSGVNCHGFLWDPPGRSVAYKAGYNTLPNHDHMGLNCGGFGVQWNRYGGKCGVCGDSYGQPFGQRDNEAGGKYALANRTVTGTYIKGQILRVEVNLTAYHKGFFTFRLCANNNFSKIVSQECLDENILTMKDSSSTKYDIANNKESHYVIELQLPADLLCSQCVLQWNYTTGNSWRQWPGEVGCLGCGPQETFINCADIAVVESKEAATTSSNRSSQSPTMSVIMRSTSIKPSTSPTASNISSAVPHSTASASSGSHVKLSTSNKDAASATNSTTTSTQTSTVTSASSETATTTSDPPSSSTTTSSDNVICTSIRLCTDMDKPSNICKCEAVYHYKAVSGMKYWCDLNCKAGYCPLTHCRCYCNN